ncbi:hypothetical protein [Arthrobacter sp. H5]|uniref:hypothetical protein n=1 Tax=Arthrobacter sp. H5 TaxID=1267973 RepID=UPI0004B13137|nr:hypothetical protein [Arthrobacter sp. H5]
MALLIGISAFAALLVPDTAGTGALFAIGRLLYAIGRQFLFPCARDQERRKDD